MVKKRRNYRNSIGLARMVHEFVSTGACNLDVQGSSNRADICHRGCAYTVFQAVQWHGVYSSACGTVHCKVPLKSFEIRVGHSPGLELPSVAILP